MLLRTSIVALVLACAEINGFTNSSQNYFHQAASASKRRAYQHVSIDTRNPDGAGTLPLSGYPTAYQYSGYPAGYQYQGYSGSMNRAAVGAGGEAEVSFRLDMAVLMEKLNIIPGLYQVVGTLNQKIDNLLNQRYSSSGPGSQAEIVALQRALLSRFDQQDAVINGLYRLVQQLQGELARHTQQTNQMHMLTRMELQKRNVEGEGNCGQKMGATVGLIQQLTDMVTQVLRILQTPGYGNAGISGPLADAVQENSRMLQRLFPMIQQMYQRCSTPDSSDALQAQLSGELASIISLLRNLPQQLLSILQNSGSFNGGGGLQPYLEQIMQIGQALLREINNMRSSWSDGFVEMRRHMDDSRKNMVAVTRVVTETTEMMQSSAAAAISASRSLRCPTSKKKSDLDDEDVI